MPIESRSVNYPANNIQLNSTDGGSVLISPHGAHVLSWMPAVGDERLFLSPKAEFRAGAAIRGGVPVVFPQFAGLGVLPKHGFARNIVWELARLTGDSAVFWLSENDATRLVWPHRFLAEYSVRIEKNQLDMALAITNTDIVPFTFTAALHTYLRVMAVADTSISGLHGLIYRDSANGDIQAIETSERLGFQGELDRIYLDAPSELHLQEPDRELVIAAEGFSDVVIWNPGPEKCAQLVDMEPQGYRQFVCVEAAAIGQPVALAPGGSWRGKQSLSV